MQDRYQRNAIYISEQLQTKIKNIRLVFLGVGLSSSITECCLRTGFENITLVDNDTISLSNLNRQNYTASDVEKYKSQTLYDRLMAINPNANINYCNQFVTETNAHEFIANADYVINTVDFADGMFFKIDRICYEMKKTVISPYNLGYTSVCYVITPECKLLMDDILDLEKNQPETEVAAMVLQHLAQQGVDISPLKKYLGDYLTSELDFIPQLAIGSYLSASLVTHILLKLVNGNKVAEFPEPNFIVSEPTLYDG